MNRVCASPIVVRGQGEHGDGAAKPVVEAATPKERSVAAIMLDHEKANQKGGSRNHKDETNPLMKMNAEPNEQPEQHERNEGDAYLEDAPDRVWVAVAADNPHPIARASSNGCFTYLFPLIVNQRHPASHIILRFGLCFDAPCSPTRREPSL
jgi:hypothetical protein